MRAAERNVMKSNVYASLSNACAACRKDANVGVAADAMIADLERNA